MQPKQRHGDNLLAPGDKRVIDSVLLTEVSRGSLWPQRPSGGRSTCHSETQTHTHDHETRIRRNAAKCARLGVDVKHIRYGRLEPPFSPFLTHANLFQISGVLIKKTCYHAKSTCVFLRGGGRPSMHREIPGTGF